MVSHDHGSGVGNFCLRGLPALLILQVMALGLTGVAPAWADESVQVQRLCTDAPVPCSIQADPLQREGASSTVAVTGRAHMVVSLQIFRLTVNDGQATDILPLGDSIEVNTDGRGVGSASLAIPPLEPDQDGGWILIAPDDVSWDDPDQILGVVGSLAARRPTILGDGYGDEKPVGQSLDLQITNAIAATSFAVEYLADDGSWQYVSSAASTVQQADGITSVSYAVPQGLEQRPYLFRLTNLTDPSAESQQWQVTPAVDPPAQDRAAMLAIPDLGSDISGAAVVGDHPQAEIRSLLIGATAITTGWLIGWPAVVARRRSAIVKALKA